MKKQTEQKQPSDSENVENEFNLLSDEEWEEIKTERIPPKEMAKKLVKFLRPNRPDYLYLKQVFKHTRQMLEVNVEKSRKRLPELLTDSELVAFYEAVWNARNPSHLVMIKLLIYTGIRNAELISVQIKDVDLTNCAVRIEQGKGKKNRYVLFPMSYRGELAQYIEKQKRAGAKFCLNQIVWHRFRPEEFAKLLSTMPTGPVLKNEFIHFIPSSNHYLSDQKRHHQPEITASERTLERKKPGNLPGSGTGGRGGRI